MLPRWVIKRRRKLRPRSVPGLLLVGYAFVALPLLAAVAFAVVYVDRLTGQSERLVLQGVAVTRYSRQLDSTITAMERNARQYAVLTDPTLTEAFAKHDKTFKRLLGALGRLDLETVPKWDLEALQKQMDAVARAVAIKPADTQKLKAGFKRFRRMRELSEAVAEQGNRYVDNELNRIQSTSREARTFILLCVVALVPATLVLMILFTVVIARPVRQIQAAVHRLGEGQFGDPVAISAPSVELDALSSQLDWMRRRLAALEREKNQFLRHMSHELKTPLASIREGSELLRDGTLGELSASQDEVVGILYKSGLELTASIENLLDFAAWKQQHSRLTFERLCVREVAAAAVARHRLSLDARKLNVALPEPAVTALADREQLRLILDNLIANAVKFSPVSGWIRIRAQRTRRATIIEVSDEGPGIAAQERNHVFTPFYQADNNAQSHVRGTGIGLSVVREGVNAHGGSIEIVDNGPGACFRITLPEGRLGDC